MQTGNTDIIKADDMIAEYFGGQCGFLCDRDITCTSGGNNDRAISRKMLRAVYDTDL